MAVAPNLFVPKFIMANGRKLRKLWGSYGYYLWKNEEKVQQMGITPLTVTYESFNCLIR